MVRKTRILKDRYVDSVVLMNLAQDLAALSGVAEASVVMGTEANLALLRDTGWLDEASADARPTDLVVGLAAEDETAADAALAELESLLTQRSGPPAGAGSAPRAAADGPVAHLDAALARQPGANLAFFSIPGAYVKHEGLKALELGLHLFLFSDNVPVADEVELKRLGRERGLLVMGPDCGTAILDGVALGFANVVPRGPVAILGASGTGIQELTCLLAQRGLGTHQAIGLGGRDLSQAVGGASMLQALDLMDQAPEAKLLILLSKPPHPEVARAVLRRAAAAKTPALVCFLGGDPALAAEFGLPFASRLDHAAALAEALLAGHAAPPEPELSADLQAEAARQAAGLAPGRRRLLGLYSGGTLCEESVRILAQRLGVPPESLEDEAAGAAGGHWLVDLGDDRYTQGRPHPMIDFRSRREALRDGAKDDLAVVLLDVVLGYGAHPDPAGELAPTLAALRQAGGPLFVASVTGTEQDPQPLSAQRARLRAAGVTVLDSNAEAALFAAAILGTVKEQP